jgi:glycosyltransferase involved in cell wall biosynthesis
MTIVLHVITGLGSGGAERMLARVATHDYGSETRQVVVSLTKDDVYTTTLRNAGLEVYSMGMRRGRPSLNGVLQLAQIVRRLRPDVVMTWMYHADLLGTLAVPLSGSPPVIWSLRCSNLDLSRHPRLTRWTIASLARLSRLPAAVAHNSRIGRDVHTTLGYRPRRWAYLPNGFDLDEWRPDQADRMAVRSELGFENGHTVIGLVARIDPEKDHATFLAAAARAVAVRPELRFVLVGRDTETLKIPDVLHGRIRVLSERSDMPRLLRGLDIATLCSLSEGFPNSVGEAMASAIPCIVTDVGDAAEIAGETGIVIPPRDSSALASAITTMVMEGKDTRQRRGQAARNRVKKNWSIHRIAQLYQELWWEVLDGHP